MKTHIPLFLSLFIKFQVLTVTQLRSFLGQKCSRPRIYEHLKDLLNWGYVERVAHPQEGLIVYRATPKLLREVLGQTEEKILNLRMNDLKHTLACGSVANSLMRYSFVSGLSLEHELGTDELKNFCQDRKPDGIVQITRGETQYELAIELETTLKALNRIEKILSAYQNTFESKKYLCAGVMIITPQMTAFETYRRTLEKMPTPFQNRIILQSDLELSSLNPKYFGAQLDRALDNPYSPPYKTRTLSGGVVRYLPMKTTEAISRDRIKGHL